MIARSRGSLSLLAPSFALATALLGAASPAAAQSQPGYASNHFDPSERGSRWFVLDSVNIQGDGRLALGMVNDYSYRSLVAYDTDGNVQSSIVRNQYQMNLGASMVLADRVRIGLNVPLQIFIDGNDGVINGVGHAASSDSQVGDVRLSLDGRVLGDVGGLYTVAIGGDIFAPSGSRDAYTSDGKPRVGPRVAFAGRAGMFMYAAKVGLLFHVRDEIFGDGYIGHQFNYAASAGVSLADDKITVGPELYGSTVMSHGYAFENRATPAEILLGTHVDLGHNIRVGAGIGTGVTRGYGAAVFRSLLSFEWVPPDPKPEAEKAKKTDRDGDGIDDCEDACGFVPGVKQTDPAKNGCPLDTDSDGVPDPVDACLNVPGVATADAKTNGCPPDLDGDGIFDNEDACPREPGKRNADSKLNGCPDRPPPSDPDRDHDGVPNETDACPDEPGKADPDPKKNGCPKAFLKDGQVKILDQVKFKTGSAELAPGKDSEDVLMAVLGVLKAHPEMVAIKVDGHTDNTGAADRNKVLSQQRAESVTKWLEQHGIDKSKLKAEGFGQEKPIDTNDTDAGRTNNRRVEFHVEQSKQQGSGQ